MTRELTVLNVNRVPKSVWRSWSPQARHVFNTTYGFAMDNPELMRHPGQLPPKPAHWKTLCWNAAWVAADAADRRVITAVIEDGRRRQVKCA